MYLTLKPDPTILNCASGEADPKAVLGKDPFVTDSITPAMVPPPFPVTIVALV
jgi:hypothetical protein